LCYFKKYILNLKNEQRRNIRAIKRNNQALHKQPRGFDNFTADTDFIADLNINSANLVDIILDVEDALKFISTMNQWKNDEKH
jgi:acyl carrier protein